MSDDFAQWSFPKPEDHDYGSHEHGAVNIEATDGWLHVQWDNPLFPVLTMAACPSAASDALSLRVEGRQIYLKSGHLALPSLDIKVWNLENPSRAVQRGCYYLLAFADEWAREEPTWVVGCSVDPDGGPLKLGPYIPGRWRNIRVDLSAFDFLRGKITEDGWGVALPLEFKRDALAAIDAYIEEAKKHKFFARDGDGNIRNIAPNTHHIFFEGTPGSRTSCGERQPSFGDTHFLEDTTCKACLKAAVVKLGVAAPTWLRRKAEAP